MDSINLPMFTVDRHGNIGSMNPTFVHLLRVVDAPAPRKILDLPTSAADCNVLEATLAKALAGLETDTLELTIMDNAGQRTVHLLLTLSTRRDAAGDVTGVVGVAQDVSSGKRTEAELSRVANDLRLLIDNANAPIFGIDANGLVNEWNRKAAEITGFAKEEVRTSLWIALELSPRLCTKRAVVHEAGGTLSPSKCSHARSSCCHVTGDGCAPCREADHGRVPR